MPASVNIKARAVLCAAVAALLLCCVCAWPYVSALGQEGGLPDVSEGEAAEASLEADPQPAIADDAQEGGLPDAPEADDAASAPFVLTTDSTGTNAKYDTVYDENEGAPSGNANAWQVVRQNYSDVKGDGAYSYSADDAVRVQKAVMPNGTENDFQVYLNVEPQLSWEEFFKSLDNYSTHNNSKTFNPSSGCSRLLSQDEYDALPTNEKDWYNKINVTYKLGGKSYDVVRYGNFRGTGKDQIQNVKNGSYAWTSEKFNTNGLIRGIDWSSLTAAAQSGRNLSLSIDASSLEEQFAFSDKPVYPKSVSDPMGENIEFKGMISADTGSVDAPAAGSYGGVVNWTLPTSEPPDPPYFSSHTEAGTVPGTNVAGSVTVLENLAMVERNGKKTAYYTGVLEMRYAIGLNTAAGGFNSCGDPATHPADQAIYNTNGRTLLSYEVDGAGKETDFPIPAVRGLLYDFELKKIDEKTGEGLPGAVFSLLNEEGQPVVDSDGAPITAISQSDGSVKFHNLPCGVYAAKEVQAPAGYLMADSPKIGTYELRWTTSKTLVADHVGVHEADLSSDALNLTLPGAMPEVANKKAIGLVVLKQDAESHRALAGVGFALFADDGDGIYTDADELAHVWSDPDMGTLGPEGETDSSGTISFYGLEPGVYWLAETRALAGYRLLDVPVKVTVTDDSRVYFHESMVEGDVDASNTVRITIDNAKIPELPVAGSSGGLLLALAGAALVAAGALVARSLAETRGKHCAR